MSTTIEPVSQAEFEMVSRLNRDLRDAAKDLNRSSAQQLVTLYYQIQGQRIRCSHIVRGSAQQNRLLDFFKKENQKLENNIKRALGEFASTYHVGQWLQSITGIGPVISAGLLAHLDVRIANVAERFWSFAGLTPDYRRDDDGTLVYDQRWKKGKKRPWNAELKTLVVFKAGDCFIKFQNHPNDVYGRVYCERKEYEIANNDSGRYSEQAALVLENKDFRRDTVAKKHYKAGQLPPGHIHSRARRYAAKLFLAHVHHVMYEDYFQKPAPLPYILSKDNAHTHFIEPPNWPYESDSGLRLSRLFEKEEASPADSNRNGEPTSQDDSNIKAE